jgi:hypothetical protein
MLSGTPEQRNGLLAGFCESLAAQERHLQMAAERIGRLGQGWRQSHGEPGKTAKIEMPKTIAGRHVTQVAG